MTAHNTPSSQDRLTSVALGFGIAVPFLYFGSQIVAALSFPGYNFLSQSASQLGSDLARYPAVFNIGAILTGFATLIASWDFLRGLNGVGTPRALIWVTAAVVALSALMHLWAGVFPMPNPRHGQNPFQIAAMALPILIGAAVWKGVRAPVRVYFVATVLALAVLMMNVVPLDRQLYDGLFQRLLALAVFPSVGVGSYLVRQRQFEA
jgi:hypothetical membrane protein